MKTYSLLRLEYNANKEIFTCKADSPKEAAIIFNRSLKDIQLDENGYAKLNDTVSFCIAEHWEPLYQVN